MNYSKLFALTRACIIIYSEEFEFQTLIEMTSIDKTTKAMEVQEGRFLLRRQAR